MMLSVVSNPLGILCPPQSTQDRALPKTLKGSFSPLILMEGLTPEATASQIMADLWLCPLPVLRTQWGFRIHKSPGLL